MTHKFFKSSVAALAFASLASSAMAAGFARGSADTDILYEDGPFTFRSSMTYVSPTRKFTAHGNPALVGTNYVDDYAIFSGAAKLSIAEDLRCAFTYSQPYGGATTFAAPTLSGVLDEDFTIDELGATCGYKFDDVGPGRAWIIGGVYMESFNYDRVSYRNATTRFHLGLAGQEFGYRIGAAYEIPEVALRAQLMYRAGSSYGAEGTLDIRTLGGTIVGGPFAAFGTGELPQNVELKLQSGIAEGWLAFASVKWTDWSVTEQLIVNVPALAVTQTNDYFWKDGWTVTGGIGHAFTEKFSGAASITWDKGIGTGYDNSNSTWTLGLGGSMKADNGGELRFGGGVTYITGGSTNPALTGDPIESVGASWAYALNASFKAKF